MMKPTTLFAAFAMTSALYACVGGPSESTPATGTVLGAASKDDGGAADGGAAEAAAPAAKCTGTPTSCWSLPVGPCAQVYGCSMDSSYDPIANTFSYECDGEAESCESQDNERDCQEQGCTWQ